MVIKMNNNLPVSPEPPTVKEELAHVAAGLRLLENPTAYFSELREKYGDTFLVDVFGFQLFCVFSNTALENFYKLPEDQASFGLATFDLMGFKTPSEIFADAMPNLFYKLLTLKQVNSYIADIIDVVELEIDRLGEAGEFEIFDQIRTLEQRIGYRLWIGEEASSEQYWIKLKQNFDVLDQEKAFVDPASVLETIKTSKKKERAAVAEIAAIIDEIWAQRQVSGVGGEDTLHLMHQLFDDEDKTLENRKVAHNTINANQGFLSNLYAAIAWCTVHVVSNDEVAQAVLTDIAVAREKYGEDFLLQLDAINEMDYIEQLLMESVRVAQRSITLRKVMQEVTLNDGQREYTVAPGAYITTLLSVTNFQPPGLEGFDPNHYTKNKLTADLGGFAKESVTTFGHGSHSCPAQRLSHIVTKVVLCKLLINFDLDAQFTHAEPSRVQLGGVARSEQPCVVNYRRRVVGQ